MAPRLVSDPVGATWGEAEEEGGERSPGPVSAQVRVAPAEASLVERALAGDAAAEGELLRGVGPRMLRVARGVLGVSPADAEDAVQESLVALLRALPSFRGECSVAHFATRIALRTAMRARKRARAEAARRQALAEGQAQLVEGAETPLATTAAARRRELLRALLDELPAEQAEALAMRVVLGHTLQEIAEASGAPVNTVRSRLRLAKEALRRRIEGDAGLSDAFVQSGGEP